MRNIVLIGMPACGKSTIGVLLAKSLGFTFTDTDLIIQQREGRLLQEIIDSDGLDAFCIAEERAILSVTAGSDTVIATGGSVVYGAKAMEHYRRIGSVVYLSLPFEELARRLHDIRGRGVALRDGQTLYDLYQERAPLYEKYADVTIEEYGLNIEQTVALIAACFSPVSGT